MNDVNRTHLEIHPENGLKMDMVADRWIRLCIGVAILAASCAVVILAVVPFLYVYLRYA